MKSVTLIVLTVITLSIFSNFSFASEGTKFLDEFDKNIKMYEKSVSKEPFCEEDLLKISTVDGLKITMLMGKVSGVQDNFTTEELTRFYKIFGRYNIAIAKFADKSSKVNC